MSMSNEYTWLEWLVALIVVVVGCCCIGFIAGRGLCREEALDAGAAEWRIDPKTGEKSFVWLGDTDQ